MQTDPQPNTSLRYFSSIALNNKGHVLIEATFTPRRGASQEQRLLYWTGGEPQLLLATDEKVEGCKWDVGAFAAAVVPRTIPVRGSARWFNDRGQVVVVAALGSASAKPVQSLLLITP